jgi:RNA polymerase sigma-70 factor (ECF subfamily)
LRVVKNAAEWQPSAKFSTWLYTIARNLCTDTARRGALRKADSLDQTPGASRDESGPHRIDKVAAQSGNAEKAAMDREIATRVDQAVAALPVEQREVFLMREVMDMSFAEIATATKTSEPTVKSRMRYALERLRGALVELRDDGGAAAAGSAP